MKLIHPNTTLAALAQQDAHVAVLHWGVPVFVLELERLTEKR